MHTPRNHGHVQGHPHSEYQASYTEDPLHDLNMLPGSLGYQDVLKLHCLTLTVVLRHQGHKKLGHKVVKAGLSVVPLDHPVLIHSHTNSPDRVQGHCLHSNPQQRQEYCLKSVNKISGDKMVLSGKILIVASQHIITPL